MRHAEPRTSDSQTRVSHPSLRESSETKRRTPAAPGAEGSAHGPGGSGPAASPLPSPRGRCSAGRSARPCVALRSDRRCGRHRGGTFLLRRPPPPPRPSPPVVGAGSAAILGCSALAAAAAAAGLGGTPGTRPQQRGGGGGCGGSGSS